MIAYLWVVPAACGAFAAIAALAYLPALGREKIELDARRARLEALGSTIDTTRAERAVERIRADVEAVQPLVRRANDAVRTLRAAVDDTGMRRAQTAVALAVASIRTLAAALRVRS